MNKILKTIAGGVTMLALFVGVAAAATTTVTVTPTNSQGWNFNPDPANATPYEFNSDQASIGVGSLYVKPIGATPAHKFIAAKTLGTLVSEFNSVSYDFLIAGNGDPTDANQFYLNVYTNLPGSTTFYDCRYDYVPLIGSTTNFTTASFSSTDVPTFIGDRTAGGDTFICPATLAGMPAGSTVSFIALNVGDTTIVDVGLAGYLDKVVINTDSDVTTYDFEPYIVASNKDQCKKGGWQSVTDENGQPFKNQGQCVSYTNHN